MRRWNALVALFMVAVLSAAPLASGHDNPQDDAVHQTQDGLIQEWLLQTRLATPEEAEEAITARGYPQAADPQERFADYVVREDLATAGDLDGAMRAMRFAHITDLQLVDDDAPYPIRQALLDDFFAATISGGAERPQEEYSDEIMHSLVDILNVHHGLDSLDFALHTGDNIDNALENELMRYIDLMEGTHTTEGPVSGLQCEPDGPSESVDDDSNNVEGSCTSLPGHVVPELRGLAPDLPWYSLYGNHDGLIQGNVPVEPSFQELAGEFGRHFLHEDDYVRMHFDDLDPCLGGSEEDDFGHGYGFAGERLCDDDVENDAYYTFDHQGVRFIILDTVNDEVYQTNSNIDPVAPDESTTGHDFVSGLSQGAIDDDQWAWLVSELDAASDRPVILTAHHTINAFYSDRFDPACGPPGCAEDVLRAVGFRGRDDMKELIAQYPNVVAFIGGHTHEHRVTAQAGGLYGDHPGYWNIETSGMLDLPQESRIVEVWVTADGSKGFFALDPIGHQFTLAQELAATDPDHDAEHAAGEPEDQRVLLWFDVPAGELLLGTQPPGVTKGNITVALLEPQAHHDNEAHLPSVGTHNITVELTDEGGEPVDGLVVSFGVTSVQAFYEEENITVPQVFTPMQSLGNGTHTIPHEFPIEGEYRVGFFLQDVDGADLGTEHFHIQVGTDPNEVDGASGLTLASVPFILLGIGLALLGARRT